MSQIKIHMIHDFVCSWCAIGYKHLTSAIDELGIDVDIRFLPHELNPSMRQEGMDIRDYFRVKHGWTNEKHDEYRTKLLDAIEESGANIDFRYRTHYFNTHLAHRLLAEAEIEGLGQIVHGRILDAYHARGINISDKMFLADLATDVGMSKQAIDRALDRYQFSLAFLEASRGRAKRPTHTVPAWVINDETLILGSKSHAFFKSHLSKLIE